MFCSSYYERPRVVLMVVICFVCFFVLIEHLKVENKAVDSGKQIDKSFIYSIILNSCALWGGVIGFGRPYLAAIIYFIGS